MNLLLRILKTKKVVTFTGMSKKVLTSFLISLGKKKMIEKYGV